MCLVIETLILETGGFGLLPTLKNGLSEAHSAFLAPKSACFGFGASLEPA